MTSRYQGHFEHLEIFEGQLRYTQPHKRTFLDFFLPFCQTLYGRVLLPTRMNFRISAKRGEGHFQFKILSCRFWELKTGLFDHEFDTIYSNFRVQGMFFNNCIEKNQNKTYFEGGSSSHTSLRDGSRYQIG